MALCYGPNGAPASTTSLWPRCTATTGDAHQVPDHPDIAGHWAVAASRRPGYIRRVGRYALDARNAEGSCSARRARLLQPRLLDSRFL